MWAGQSAGLVTSVEPVREIVEQIVRDAETAIRRHAEVLAEQTSA